MSQSKQPKLRFDHKEIAVIFSLFVFVSLLMFTVGIVVGKGLTLAKYQNKERVQKGAKAHSIAKNHALEDTLEKEDLAEASDEPHSSDSDSHHAGTSVSTHEPRPHHSTPPEPTPQQNALKLEPKKERRVASTLGDSLLETQSRTNTRRLLKNPKIRALVESAAPKSKTSKSPEKVPTSYSNGAYTVQIGSYPKRLDAQARVDELKKMGFAHAYLSAKQLGDRRKTWFRVWLGYYPSFNSAQKNAEFLQKKGDVKNYLVRKSKLAG